MSRSSLLLLVLVAGVGAWGAPAHAYVTESTKWNPSSLPIGYSVNTGSIPSSITGTGVGSVDAGFTTWSGPTCTSWAASDSGSTTATASASDRRNVILWLSGGWPSDLGDPSSVIGVTTPVWTVGGYFNDADIRFNNVGFHWNTTGSGGVDTQSIATHEEGHFLGLDHTSVHGAIMYPSYSGSLVRTLASDDSAGVCFLYPSGVAPTDAGTPPPRDGGSTSSDPCNAHGSTCDGCTPYGGCGFCGASSSCISGTGTAAPAGCSSGWVWYPTDCTGSTGGTGRFGDPCSGPGDCGSGAPCVAAAGGGGGFCSQACADDCTCPGGYACFMTSTPGLSVCAPGTNMCATPPPVDAGTTPPPVDSGTTPPPIDSGTTSPPDDSGATTLPDGGTTTGLDLGSGGHHTRTGGCCSVPGSGSVPAEGGLAAMILAGLVGVVRVRRRAR